MGMFVSLNVFYLNLMYFYMLKKCGGCPCLIPLVLLSCSGCCHVVMAVLGDVSALTGGRLGHHTPRGGISLEKVTCNFKVLISQQGQRGEKHHKDEGAALESLDSTEGDNLLFKYIWKKRTFCPHTPAPGKPLRFSSLWKYFVFDFRTPAQFSKAK